jgi:hypothetical protein
MFIINHCEYSSYDNDDHIRFSQHLHNFGDNFGNYANVNIARRFNGICNNYIDGKLVGQSRYTSIWWSY